MNMDSSGGLRVEIKSFFFLERIPDEIVKLVPLKSK